MSINKNIFYTFLTQFPVQLFGIASGIFIARMIGPEGKGVFAIYQANAQLLMTFFAFSFSSVLAYFIPSEKIKKEKLLGLAILISIIGSIFIILVIILSGYSGNKNYFFPARYYGFLYLTWLYLFSILSIITNIFMGFFQGLKLFNVINKVHLINSLLNFLFFGLLFLVHYTKLFDISVPMLLYCLLMVTIINMFQYLVPFYKKINILPDFRISFRNDIKPILSFTFYTYSGSFISFINSRLSLWILNTFLNEAAIGLFSIAMNFMVIFNMVSVSVGNVLMPFLSSNEIKNKNDMFYTYSKLNFTLLSAIGLVIFFISFPLIPLFYGEAFIESVLLLQILLPGIILSCSGRLLAVFIAANNKQQYNLLPSLFGFIANFFLNIYLISFYGLIGASIACSLTYILTFFAMMYFVHVKLHLPFGNYFLMPFKDIKSYLFTGLINLKTLRND